MSAWAKVGAKCVCIRTMPEAFRIAGAVYPEVGSIYTIRAVVTTTIGKCAGQPALLLEEISNPLWINIQAFGVNSRREAAMPIDAFRPLINKTLEEDIAMFKSLLAKTPEQV